MTEFSIEGAAVILPGEIVQARVCVADGRIAEIGGPARGEIIDGRGLTLAPALIDVHGDAFERQVMPRPGVFFPADLALLETDRQLAANGIATTYHALTLSWEPGLRSVERGKAILAALEALRGRLTIENRVQLRWETFAFEAMDVIAEALAAPLTPALAFNDHTSMGMRPHGMPVQERAFEHSAAFALASLDDPRHRHRQAAHAQRAGMDLDAYLNLFREVWARRDAVPAAIDRLAQIARDVGAPMLSHDDTQAETRQFYRQRGAHVAEFPMTMAPTRDARNSGDAIIFGAPNVIRGGSHIGSLAAADMVEEGLCDALASDYYYPAMLAAVAKLEEERRASRADLWGLVSSGPARAMGLGDRGAIRDGARADLVLVDWPQNGPPAIRATWCSGKPAYRSEA